MKITIVSVGPPYRGGISDLSAELYVMLSNNNDVNFINFSRQYPKFLFPGKTEFKDGVELFQVPYDNKGIDSINPLTWIKVAFEIRKKKKDWLIFRYWNPFFAPMIFTVSILIRFFSETKIGLLADNLMPHEPSFLDKFMAKVAMKYSHTVFTLSKAVQADANLLFPSKKNVLLFHPLYESFIAEQSKEEAKKLLKISSPMVLFFGLIRPYKGVDTLLNAIPILKNKGIKASYWIVGEAYEDEKPYLELIQKLNIQDDVKWENTFVPDDAVQTYFKASDIVVLPYKTATQSGIIGIAYHMNRPIIVTDVGGLSEYVIEGKTGFVIPPESPENIANAISNALTGERAKILADGVRHHKEKWSMGTFSKDIQMALEDV